MDCRSASRIERHTSAATNQKIIEDTKASVTRWSLATDDELRDRLHALDAEWDVERAIEANAGAAVMGSLLLGRLVDKRFYVLTGVIGALLIQFSRSGFWPNLGLWRMLGFRTTAEIDFERASLQRALRARGYAAGAGVDDAGLPDYDAPQQLHFREPHTAEEEVGPGPLGEV